ncbi:MAG: hypothetical protein ACT4OF_06275 [Caulobacteraceae bacterium]
MGIQERIPDLSDKELESLRANALRLKDAGSVQQRQQAEELLPLLGAALEERRLARVAAHTETRRANARKKERE